MSQTSGLPVSRRRVLQAGCLGNRVGGRRRTVAQRSPAAAGHGGRSLTSSRVRQSQDDILLFMWGGPSHIDTLDPKPDAPAEVRRVSVGRDGRPRCADQLKYFKHLPGLMDRVSLIVCWVTAIRLISPAPTLPSPVIWPRRSSAMMIRPARLIRRTWERSCRGSRRRREPCPVR